MQYMTVARDIIKQSKNAGVTYIPKSYLTAEEYTLFTADRCPEKIPIERLKEIRSKLIDNGEKCFRKIDQYDFLAKPGDLTLKILTVIYQIQSVIMKRDANIGVERLNKWELCNILLKNLYLTPK